MIRWTRTAAAGSLLAVLGAIGCAHGNRPGFQERYDDWVDPCWPERYSAVARAEVLDPFAAQATNGAVLDATLWNYHFEPASKKLTPAGMEKLDYLVRRRPGPELHLFVQTARDTAYLPDATDKFVADRAKLDADRIEEVKKYFSSQVAAKGAKPDVAIIDPSDPSIPARYPGNAVGHLPDRYTAGPIGGGGMGGGGGGGAATTGGR
jgi:hypothetical protein